MTGGTCTSTGSYAPAPYKLYWRGESGNTLAETDATGSTSNSYYHEYIFFAGMRIARSDVSSSTVYYYFVDQIGSTRVVAQADGTVSFKQEYFPYGQEVYSQSFDPGYKFAGYEADPESGLAYAFARYYSPLQGRFTTADPVGGDLGDPQTLNRYSYVRNNPINMADPSGQCGLSLGFFVDPFGDYLGFLGGGGGNGGGGGGVGIYVGFGGFGGGRCGGDDRAGPQPPVYTPPQVGTDPNRSTDGFGCPYGSGSCGGIVFGYQDPGDLTWEVPTAWAILRALGPELVRLFWPVALSRSSRKPDLAQVDRIAKDFCVDRNALGDAIHDEKKGGPKGKGGDLTEEEIKNIARRLPKIPGCTPTAQ